MWSQEIKTGSPSTLVESSLLPAPRTEPTARRSWRSVWRVGKGQETIFEPLAKTVENGLDLTLQLDEKGRGRLFEAAGVVNLLMNRFHLLVTGMAGHSIALSRTSPRLAALAGELATCAQSQAIQAEQISTGGRILAHTVGAITQSTEEAAAFSLEVIDSMNSLSRHSSRLGEIVILIQRIASQTHLLGINASIEAARAGEHGKPFGVISGEVRNLALQCTEAFSHVDDLLRTMQASVRLATEKVGSSQDLSASVSNHSHRSLCGLVGGIAASARAQHAEVQKLASDTEAIAAAALQNKGTAVEMNSLAVEVRGCSEKLILAMGQFRFAAHRRARRVLEALAQSAPMQGEDVPAMEERLRQAARKHPGLELLYVTNRHGVQITDNIAAGHFAAVYGSTGRDRDWSARDWFRQVAQSHRTFVSPIYRSAASDDFCVTLSTPL